jgi:LysM repeat protein
MENDNISSSSSESKLPLIVGILGFALGAAGLVLGIKAKGAAQAAGDEAAAAKTSVAELGAALAGKANSADVQAIAADLAATKQSTEANEKALADQIAALQKVASAPKAAKGADGKSAAPAGPGEHVVAKGETLGGIAKKAGLSVKALTDLNPGVNANRLQIGQKLKTK